MSTRAQIKHRNSEFNIYVYKHKDGYPEGVLPVLIPFVKSFIGSRGDDECYMIAQLIRAFAFEDIKNNPKFYDHNSDSYCNFLGWGVDCIEHGDIEYLYEIDGKGNIYVNNKKLTKKQREKYLK